MSGVHVWRILADTLVTWPSPRLHMCREAVDLTSHTYGDRTVQDCWMILLSGCVLLMEMRDKGSWSRSHSYPLLPLLRDSHKCVGDHTGPALTWGLIPGE
jgi:hypothetical protein